MKNIITIKVNEILLKMIVFVIPVFLILCFYLLQKTHYPTYCAVVSEDNVVEYMQSIFYLLSSIIAFCIAITFVKKHMISFGILYILLGIGMFFFFGEEINWGTRILAMKTSGFFLDHNLQKEINLHNLDYFRGFARWFYILTGFYGAFFWLINIPLKRKKSTIINPYFIPQWYLMGYFFTVSAYYIYLYFILPYNNFLKLTWREQEPAELFLSMGFLLFVTINRFRQIQELKIPESNIIAVSSIRYSDTS